MNVEREKVRCRDCELVEWRDHELCRRCGATLPEPLVKIVERVVERIVLRPCERCGNSTAAESVAPSPFPTMAEVERRMILAAYSRSNRRPVEAARMRGIGKTTMYRKLREMKAA
jgi:transcriptional regulator of acetoin/glycerol metabolism